jgi:hypothetical protein
MMQLGSPNHNVLPVLSVTGVTALANAIPDMRVLSSANLLGNYIPVEQAQELVKIMQAKEKLTTLCGLSKEETELDFSDQNLGAGDAVLIANDISDMGAMTSLNLALNRIGSEGAKHIAEAIKVSVLLWLFCYQFYAHLTNGSTAVVCHCPQDMGAISKHVNKQSLVVFLRRHCPDEVTNAEEWLQQYTGDQIVADALENFGEAPGYTTVQNDNRALSTFTFSGDCSRSEPVTMETTMTEADFSGKELGVSGGMMVAAFLPKCQ